MQNNHNLVRFAKSKLGTPYVYGAKGEVVTEQLYYFLKNLYPQYVPDTDKKKIGKVCTDCSGLISWCTGITRSSQQYHDKAKEVYPILTIATAPIGVAVWRKGHIGIYIGNNEIIEARGSKYGVVKTNVKDRDFTHWFYICDINYVQEVKKATNKATKQMPLLKKFFTKTIE